MEQSTHTEPGVAVPGKADGTRGSWQGTGRGTGCPFGLCTARAQLMGNKNHTSSPTSAWWGLLSDGVGWGVTPAQSWSLSWTQNCP